MAGLVLSRKIGERIFIGTPPHEVILMVTEIRRNCVRLAIDAPLDTKIIREELLHRAENAKAITHDELGAGDA